MSEPTDSWEEKFLCMIETFMRRTGTPPTVLGRQALNDPAFIIHLKAGRSPSLRIADKVRRYCKENGRRRWA